VGNAAGAVGAVTRLLRSGRQTARPWTNLRVLHPNGRLGSVDARLGSLLSFATELANGLWMPLTTGRAG
jgi:hypothetical protein